MIFASLEDRRDTDTMIRHIWRHQMETFSAILALCEGNSPVTGEFPSQRPVTRNFDVFFDLRLNKRLSKQSRRKWFETPSGSLWRHYHVLVLPWVPELYIPPHVPGCCSSWGLNAWRGEVDLGEIKEKNIKRFITTLHRTPNISRSLSIHWNRNLFLFQWYIDGLVQERRKCSALAMELPARLSCTSPSI